MLEKNYTNPDDKVRFGFGESGKYRAPYKADTVLAALCMAAAVMLNVMVFLALARFVRENPIGVGGALLLLALAAAFVAMILCPLIIVAGVISVRLILQGFECRYFADEDKFTAVVGRTSHTIYYKDVQAVHFLPHVLNGAVRGYTVTVKVSGVNEEFEIVSDGYIAENTTPFYIIKERAELLREARLRGNAANDAVTELPPSLKPPKKADVTEIQSALERMERIQGDDIEPSEASEVETLLPDIARRVSPTVNGYADDLPAVGRDGKVIREDRKYFGSDGREVSVTDVIAKGSFRVLVKPPTMVIMGAAAAVLYALFFWFASQIGNPLIDPVTLTVFHLTVSQLTALIIAPFWFGTMIKCMDFGRTYNYRADGIQFVITSKGIPDEFFRYSDVQSVTYKRFGFLWFLKGYKVKILTRFGIKKYNYVITGFGRLPLTKNLPFEVIRERTEQK